MRLRRLDLTRYGKFTDHSIDFGAAVPGQPDLHIIYGPNEAGKSTATAAVLDLLFGFGKTSPYNFRHPYDTMRIGAMLETLDGPRGFARLKRPKGSLLDGCDRTISDTSLVGDLAGLDRAAYQAMFCLDDDTLEAGGRSILESKGELGQLLFSASSGLADLSRTILRLRGEADGFYKFHAHGGALARLKGELAALKDQRDQLDTAAAEYHRLVEQRDRDAELYQRAQEERGEQQRRIEAVRRSLEAFPHWEALRRARLALAAFADLPDPPAGWAVELPRLQRDDVELATRAGTLDEDIAERARQMGEVVVDETAAGLAVRVGELAGLRARHVTAALDIPERRGALARLDADIATALARLDRAGEAAPGRLVIAASLSAVLTDLIGKRSGIAEALDAATREHSGAEQRLAGAHRALVEAGGTEAAAGDDGLRAIVAAVRGSDHAVRRRTAERARDTARIKLDDHGAALRPWSGEVAELARMVVPDGSVVVRWKVALEQARRDIAQQDEALAKLAADATRTEAELGALASVLGVVSDGEAADIRAAREAAWAAHRRAFDAGSADAFEAALRRDDLVTGARLGHQADLVRSQEMMRARAMQSAERLRLEGLRVAGMARAAAVEVEIAGAVAVGMPAGMGPEALETWLARRAVALETWQALRLAEADMAAAEADAADAAVALAGALARAGVPHDPAATVPALLAVADGAIAREGERAALRAKVIDCEGELAQRSHALQSAIGRDQAWRVGWKEACTACWLGDQDPPPEPAEVAGRLAALNDLAALLQRRADLDGRIEDMLADQARFATEVEAIAGVLGIDPAAQPALEVAQRIADRVRAAQDAAAQRDEMAGQLARKRDARRELAGAESAHASRKGAMLAFFGVATLDEVAARLHQAGERDRLNAGARTAAAQMVEALGVETDGEAEAHIAGLSRDALQAELAVLRTEAEPLEARTRELYAQSRQSAHRIEAIGGDDAVARTEVRRRTILLEIEEAAGAYLRLRAGVIAAEMALRAYRDQHRGAMMTRASEAFRTISRGAYTSLTSRLEKDTEVLIAIAADGASKLADDLSKGTRFQLYLALRAAGYQEFVATRHAVPFIADDIMETFDDFRAEETFRVLGDMAGVGQVIYLTHHLHLAEIGQRVVPAARIHRLDA